MVKAVSHIVSSDVPEQPKEARKAQKRPSLDKLGPSLSKRRQCQPVVSAPHTSTSVTPSSSNQPCTIAANSPPVSVSIAYKLWYNGVVILGIMYHKM